MFTVDENLLAMDNALQELRAINRLREMIHGQYELEFRRAMGLTAVVHRMVPENNPMDLNETIAVLELAGWKLGDINEFLEIQGYPEVTVGCAGKVRGNLRRE